VIVSQGPRLTFDHVTYLQGASDTLFLNGNIMELFWTQVVENQTKAAGDAQGLLYGYGLNAPHRFRQGSLDFSSEVKIIIVVVLLHRGELLTDLHTLIHRRAGELTALVSSLLMKR
jgi:hypothetical protein